MAIVNMGAWVANNATIVGDVTLGEDASVWYGAVLRGDSGSITIGDGTNIQDNSVVHDETTIGKFCTIGHGAIVHGCTIGDNTMVGMGAIVLNDAIIGPDCIIGAGAVVTGKMNAPAGSLILGNPAKIVKELSQAQIDGVAANAKLYVGLAQSGLPEKEI